MGVPVVTLVGESFHQRISYSNLMHCGLEELCTFTPENFVERAVALANEREILLAMRQGLREVMSQSPLCDEEQFPPHSRTPAFPFTACPSPIPNSVLSFNFTLILNRGDGSRPWASHLIPWPAA